MIRHRIQLAWMLLGLGLGGGVGCSRQEPPASGQRPPASEVIPGGDDFHASVPSEGGPEGYVGSQPCRQCHEEQFSSWHRTYHRTMTQYATPETVQADFNDVTLTNDNTRFHLTRAGEELRVKMERILPPGPSTEPPPSVETRASLVTGSHHMQVFWVPGGSGNAQVGFPFTWLIPEHRWVPRSSTFIRPPGFTHQPEVWNVMCSRCHSTAIEPRVDSVKQHMDSRAAELGISCEACHGPGERHVAARLAADPNAPKPTGATLREEILHPEKIDPVRASQVCGFCHSMKWIDRTESWRQAGFRFRPGDDLAATTPLIQPQTVAEIPGLQAYLERNPTLLNDYFWSDGMGRVSGREYNGLASSPCFKGGQFSCLSCHSLHDSEPSDLLAKDRQDNRACTQCHENFRDAQTLTRHTHHLPNSSGSQCYNCHMPHTTYGVLSAIRSHQISNPRVSDELATGRPNACNLCHLDKPLAWTAQHLNQWYQQPSPPLDSAAQTVADAVRLAVAGDAGQRALLAWHFGWGLAREVSGTDWIPPILGVLLDDPYPAVRCVASRSLRATSNLEPAGYDFVIPPSDRPSAAAQVWAAWSAQAHPPTPVSPRVFSPEVLVKPGPTESLETLLGPLRRTRDDRPMRLRE